VSRSNGLTLKGFLHCIGARLKTNGTFSLVRGAGSAIRSRHLDLWILDRHRQQVWSGAQLRGFLLAASCALALLPCKPALAQTQPTTPLAETQPVSTGYMLTPGDRVVVAVLGQPEFTGELPIDNDGDIALPLIGSVHVGGLMQGQAQELIRARLADGYLVSPSVSVRLGELRPFYILGSVRSPGAYPFRFGTVVRAAIAAAGGYAASDPLQRQAVAESLTAEERLQQLVQKQAVLLIRQARLQAEVKEQDGFAIPDLPERPPEDQLAQIVGAETDALTSQLRMVRAKVDLLQSQKPRIQSQIEATNSEISSATKRLQLVRSEMQRSNALVQQGIGTRTIAVQNKLAEATEETNLWRLKGEIFRLERETGEIDLRIAAEQLSLRNQATTELSTVRSQIAELDVLVPAARKQRDWKLKQAGLVDPEGEYRITITRVRAGVAKVQAADSKSLLEPGDLIEVKPVAPASGWPRYSTARSPLGRAAQP